MRHCLVYARFAALVLVIFQLRHINVANLLTVSSSSVASLDKIELKEVLATINSVYGTSQVLNAVTGSQPSLPLQQQLIVCSLLLMMDHETKKLDITLGKVI